MRHAPKLALIAGLLALVLGSVGCGGDDDARATASGVPKAIYAEKGDRICKANYAKRTKLLQELGKKFPNPPPVPQQEKILVNQIMPIFWEESEELNELPLPEEGAAEAKRVLAALEESIKGVEANPIRSLEKGSEVEFKDAQQLAEAFGFEVCGRS